MTIRITYIMYLMLALTLVACDRHSADWEEAQQEDTIAAYEAFIESYPDSPETDQARSRIETLRAEQAWVEARQHDTIEAHREFLENHPDAAGADEAQTRLQSLEREAAWQSLASSNDINALQAFAEDHAGSPEAELARTRASDLEARAQAEAEAEAERRERERELEREREREREAQRQAEQGTHRVQLAVVRQQDQASSGIEQLQQQLGEVLGDVGLETQRTNGMFRLVTLPISLEQAQGLCEALKQQGQDCLVRQR